MTPRASSSRRLLALVVSGALTLPLAAPIARAAGPTTTQSVEQLAEQAYQLHEQGKFTDAIAVYLKVYEISKAGAVLYNVATIYDRKLHEREAAAEFYRRYLRSPDAEAEIVKRAVERLEALKKEAEAEPPLAPPPTGSVTPPPPPPVAPPTVAPPPPTPEPPPQRSSAWRTTGLVVGAVGLGGLAASAVAAIAAKSRNDQANNLCNGSACTTEQGVLLAHDAGTYATISTATFAAGAALVGVGLVVYLVAPWSTPAPASGDATAASAATRPTLTLEPLIGPGTTGTMLRGSF